MKFIADKILCTKVTSPTDEIFSPMADCTENMVWKGDIIRPQHFLVLLQCLASGRLQGEYIVSRRYGTKEHICNQSSESTDKQANLKRFFGGKENLVGKGKNAGYQHFFLFPKCFKCVLFENIVGKEKKYCLLPAFSSFPPMLSDAVFR